MWQNKNNDFHFLFLCNFENDNLFLEGGAIAPNSSPQLRH